MISLFIDTSSKDVSIALFRDSILLSSISEETIGGHSKYTVDYINKILEANNVMPIDVNKIFVVTGPGSFTGLRIGVTIAKVFSFLQNIPVVSISSLKMRSLSLKHDYCLSIMDARRGNYYVGLYDENNDEIIPEQFMSKDKIISFISQYHPVIVSDMDGFIDTISYQKVDLDFSSIVSYYSSCDEILCHLLNPNYLKLPQVLENVHD